MEYRISVGSDSVKPLDGLERKNEVGPRLQHTTELRFEDVVNKPTHTKDRHLHLISALGRKIKF